MPRKNAAEEEYKVTVCRSRWVWSNPRPVYRDNNFYYITDGVKGCHTSIKYTSLEQLARELYDGVFTSKPVRDPNMIDPKPATPYETYYLDGYFGRPLIPSKTYRYFPLKRKEFKELKEHLMKLIQAAQSN